MRVLVLHNRYQVAGGEDTAVRQEVSMLRQAGLAVDLLEVTNEHIQGPLQRAATALNFSLFGPFQGSGDGANRRVTARSRACPQLFPRAHSVQSMTRTPAFPSYRRCIITVCCAPTPCSSAKTNRVRIVSANAFPGRRFNTPATAAAAPALRRSPSCSASIASGIRGAPGFPASLPSPSLPALCS